MFRKAQSAIAKAGIPLVRTHSRFSRLCTTNVSFAGRSFLAVSKRPGIGHLQPKFDAWGLAISLNRSQLEVSKVIPHQSSSLADRPFPAPDSLHTASPATTKRWPGATVWINPVKISRIWSWVVIHSAPGVFPWPGKSG